MSLFYMDADPRELLRDELRAEARAERAVYRRHWCALCHGFDGPGSPCYVEPEEDGCRNAPAQDEEDGDE